MHTRTIWVLISPLGASARRSNQSILKEINLNFHWKDWCWCWSANILATWCKELTHWKRSWCWERLREGEEGEDRRQVCWMASPTQWTWVWTNSSRWLRTGKPGMLQSMGSQRVRHDLATKQQLDIPPESSWIHILLKCTQTFSGRLYLGPQIKPQ